MYLGKTDIYYTKNRIYDVVEYATLPDGNPKSIIIKNDKGFYETFYLEYPLVSKYFKDVTLL